ncbi:hypothetical protein OHT57_26460 [Streptomyces sp. NBC_00285]|uniref:hypothetical protein n=1 Tax=Streptomyces sp. NBC_00285 TaxID=2975700 RepID=UPI002E2E6D8F|nr:hypothetical protein [Streptomyces sp. NBC_00285]
MTDTQTGTAAEQTVRGRTRWGVLAAILAVPTLVVAGLIALLVAWLFTDDSVDSGFRSVSCAKALSYGGAQLPDGAYDTACSQQAGQKPRYEVLFRMPRDGVRDWLTATYPDATALRADQCRSGISQCLTPDPAAAQGASVQVEITDNGKNWSDVRFVASAP